MVYVQCLIDITSEESRSRAWDLCQEMQWEIYLQYVQDLENQKRTEVALEKRGYIFHEFICIACNRTLHSDGVMLLNCRHPICLDDFHSTIQTQCANSVKDFSCPFCQKVQFNFFFLPVNPSQIEEHCKGDLYNKVADLLSQREIESWENSKRCCDASCNQLNVLSEEKQPGFVCEKCKQPNCLQCKALHEPSDDCKYFQFNQVHWFRSKWTGNHDKANSSRNNYVVLMPVASNSPEWNA
ncbi:hypothetical protein RFI_16412, partial [Reticulomyxa filosa]